MLFLCKITVKSEGGGKAQERGILIVLFLSLHIYC